MSRIKIRFRPGAVGRISRKGTDGKVERHELPRECEVSYEQAEHFISHQQADIVQEVPRPTPVEATTKAEPDGEPQCDPDGDGSNAAAQPPALQQEQVT